MFFRKKEIKTEQALPTEKQLAQIERKYGMFIHFGINTFNDCEWSDGSLPLSSYNPSAIDADSWIRNARDAGMKYVILISKHHDGFCLFHTEYTDYCVKNTSNPTDVVKAVSEACKKYGVQLGLYYSLWDRHEKCYKDDVAYNDYMCNQLTELFDGRYGDICELWLDGSWDKLPMRWDIPRVYALVQKLQPKCVVAVNHTIGNQKKRISKRYRPEHYKPYMPIRYFPSDFRLADPFFPPKGDADPKLYVCEGKTYYLPFEATICIRNMSNWFWDPKYTSDRLLTPEFIAQKYNELISQKNVLVVNVAPNTYGKQEESDVAVLLKTREILGI